MNAPYIEPGIDPRACDPLSPEEFRARQAIIHGARSEPAMPRGPVVANAGDMAAGTARALAAGTAAGPVAEPLREVRITHGERAVASPFFLATADPSAMRERLAQLRQVVMPLARPA